MNSVSPLPSAIELYVENPVTGCWIYIGAIDDDGYGTAGSRPAHRVFYEHYVGPIPDGLSLDHLCVRRNCVNPKHLEPVTARENSERARRYSRRLFRHEGKCVRGHMLTDENTRPRERTRVDGSRYVSRECLLCQRERAGLTGLPGVKPADRTHCPQGHPLSGENLRIETGRVGTKRRCRACRIESSRRKHAGMLPSGVSVDRPTGDAA